MQDTINVDNNYVLVEFRVRVRSCVWGTEYINTEASWSTVAKQLLLT